MYTVGAIPPYLIDFMWKHIEQIIVNIIDRAHGEMSLDTVKYNLKNDKALLVVVMDNDTVKGIAIFQVEVFDTGKRVLNLSMAGGQLNLFTGEYDDIMIGLAKDLNCEEIRAMGARTGWERALKNTKWSTISTTLIYKLEK